MSLAPNTRLGRYEIRRQIGAGGMGEVYLASDSLLGREVALKVLSTQFASEPHQLARFVQEARAASALNHPNVLTVYDVGEQSGMHFIVTELVDGLTLRDWVREARPRWPSWPTPPGRPHSRSPRRTGPASSTATLSPRT